MQRSFFLTFSEKKLFFLRNHCCQLYDATDRKFEVKIGFLCIIRAKQCIQLKIINTLRKAQDCHYITNTGGPRYSRTFYLQICLFTFREWSKMTIFYWKMDVLSANSGFEVQNDRGYLPKITKETCSIKASIRFHKLIWCSYAGFLFICRKLLQNVYSRIAHHHVGEIEAG